MAVKLWRLQIFKILRIISSVFPFQVNIFHRISVIVSEREADLLHQPMEKFHLFLLSLKLYNWYIRQICNKLYVSLSVSYRRVSHTEMQSLNGSEIHLSKNSNLKSFLKLTELWFTFTRLSLKVFTHARYSGRFPRNYQKSLARFQKRWHITSVASKIRFIWGLHGVYHSSFVFQNHCLAHIRIHAPRPAPPRRRAVDVSQLCVVTRSWRGPHAFIRIKIWACFRNTYTDTGRNAEYITVVTRCTCECAQS